jgi:hypothetical protein
MRMIDATLVRGHFLTLALRSLGNRIAALLLFASALLLVAAALRLVAFHDGHVESEALFRIGGYPLVSAMLLLGWVLGRFPLVATLVLMAGIFSHDRAQGYTRLYAARPVSLISVYGTRFLLLAALAFVLSALVMPAFDLLLLGRWAGGGTLVLTLAYIVVFGGLTAFLSLWTRADAWIALLLAILAIGWHTLRSADLLTSAPPAAREAVTLMLPPHGALFALESAFAGMAPIPWDAFLYAASYGIVLLAITALLLGRKEI